MSITYHEYEKTVFEWLMQKHQYDETFCFSTRQKAVKGSEKDYFIGTERSGYFATTFWWAPVSFPGSSSDLINLIFRLKGGDYFTACIQFSQTRKPHDKQNQLALQFIQELKAEFRRLEISFWENNPSNSMEYYDIVLYKGTDQEEMLKSTGEQLNKIIPVLDNFLNIFKATHVTFDASRIDKDRFENLYVRKLNERMSRNEPSTVTAPITEAEPIKQMTKADYKHYVNTILYGPPGTGKTYRTVDMALEIADPDYYQENSAERKDILERFSELQFRDFQNDANAQIAFCTFHQSLGYEDFIEGIKPIVKNEQVQYEIQDGIFKRIANAARKNYLSSLEMNLEKEDFDIALEKLKEEWEKNKSMKFSMKTKGYEFQVTEFTEYSIRFKKATGGDGHTLSLATLEDAYYGNKIIPNSGIGIYYPGILEKLYQYRKPEGAKAELRNYVLIIDEINRGNVSQIFGELITCIEKSKRLGNKEEQIEVILPYSKTSFSVPPNLYIVGTMNTADRSVEALDTALRRRFRFEEMVPDPKVIDMEFKRTFLNKCVENNHLEWDDPEWKRIEEEYLPLVNKTEYLRFVEKVKEMTITNQEPDYDHFERIWDDLKKPLLTVEILETINQRIEVLLNRDNLIGHSYFIHVYTWDHLRDTLFKNILPLLQEYFYGDYGKIGLVLGAGFVRIKSDEDKNKVRFASFVYSDTEALQKIVYELIPKQEVAIESAIQLLLNKPSNSL